jgi:hypothetical protein
MTMRDECVAPNRKRRALMLQMNAVDLRISQNFRLLTLEKFGADRDRATEPDGGSKRGRPAGESAEHKKDIAPYSLKPLKK